ncbi:hypothetical protein HDU96_003227 [Phlyctochytrium bullatum]|nr:hypothetical protein HDU96_003227 [Phlyctochytrium bullatum]
MSSLKKSIPQKTHRERAQPKARAHLGLLEKKKDYVLRAKDYSSKQRRLKALRQKALTKNPDEFYFAMINSKVKNGVHVKNQTRETYDQDFLRLLKTQDKSYVNYHRSVNLKKLQKLEDSLSVTGMIPEGEEDEGAVIDDFKRQGSHILFVDDEEEAAEFDLKEYRKKLSNERKAKSRRKVLDEEEDLEEEDEDEAEKESKPILNPKVLKRREAAKRELESRKAREEKLRQVQQEMELQKNLMVRRYDQNLSYFFQGKGSKKKVGTDKNGLAIYKWKAERKR